MNVTLRGLATADIARWSRFLADVERFDRTGEHYNEDDLAEEMANPDIDPATDMVGAFDGDEMVGYFIVYPRAANGEYHMIHLEGSVRPDRRGQGLGSRLVEAMLMRAEAAHQERHPELPARYALTGVTSNKDQERLLADFGLVPERWNFVMRAQLDGVADPSPLAEGAEIRKYDASVAQAMKEAHNVAFLDHPNFSPWTDVMWKQWVTDSRNFRPDLSFVVVQPDAPGRVVAYVQTNEYDAHFAATGRREAYIAKVGTLREFRGRGLAFSLLRHVLVDSRDAGYDEAALDVDSENPTGALGVYERAGFVVENRWSNYAKTVRPTMVLD